MSKSLQSMEIPVQKKQIEKAVKALLSHLQPQETTLYDQKEFLYLTVTLQNFQKQSLKLIQLSHPITTQDRILLVVKDSTKKDIKTCLEKDSVQVISVGKLKKITKSFQEKRNLLQEFSMIIVDDCLVNLLPRILGKKFYDKKKIPIPIKIKDISRDSLMTQIKDISENSTSLIQGNGICVSLKVGNTDLSLQENADNVWDGVVGVGARVYGKWENIQSIHLKSKESVALPIYEKKF